MDESSILTLSRNQLHSQIGYLLEETKVSNRLPVHDRVIDSPSSHDDNDSTSSSNESNDGEPMDSVQSKHDHDNPIYSSSDESRCTDVEKPADYEKHQRYLTANGHVKVERISKHQLLISTTNSYNTLQGPKTRQSNYSHVRVSHVSFSELRFSRRRVHTQKKTKDDLTTQEATTTTTTNNHQKSKSTFSSKNENNRSKTRQRRHKKSATTTQTHNSKMKISSIYKEQAIKKKQDYLTAHGHVSVDHPSKSAIEKTQNNIKMGHVSFSNLQSYQSKSKTSKCSNHHMAKQIHVYVTGDPRVHAFLSAVIDHNNKKKQVAPRQVKNQIQVTHVNPTGIQFFTMCKETEEQKKNQEYITAHGHVSIRRVSKQELLTTPTVERLKTGKQVQEPIINGTNINYDRKNRIESSNTRIKRQQSQQDELQSNDDIDYDQENSIESANTRIKREQSQSDELQSDDDADYDQEKRIDSSNTQLKQEQSQLDELRSNDDVDYDREKHIDSPDTQIKHEQNQSDELHRDFSVNFDGENHTVLFNLPVTQKQNRMDESLSDDDDEEDDDNEDDDDEDDDETMTPSGSCLSPVLSLTI